MDNGFHSDEDPCSNNEYRDNCPPLGEDILHDPHD